MLQVPFKRSPVGVLDPNPGQSEQVRSMVYNAPFGSTCPLITGFLGEGYRGGIQMPMWIRHSDDVLFKQCFQLFFAGGDFVLLNFIRLKPQGRMMDRMRAYVKALLSQLLYLLRLHFPITVQVFSQT